MEAALDGEGIVCVSRLVPGGSAVVRSCTVAGIGCRLCLTLVATAGLAAYGWDAYICCGDGGDACGSVDMAEHEGRNMKGGT